MRRKVWIAFRFLVIFCTLGLATLAFVLLRPGAPLPAYQCSEISRLVDKLNYFAAVHAPHHQLGESVRQENLRLFETVESGAELNAERSAEYRILYQSILRKRQWLLSLFDRDLKVIEDFAMSQPNNVGGSGINGQHDHHDFSAKNNLQVVKVSMWKIQKSDGWAASLKRAFFAANAQKDLTDIILHLATAPHTKSVPFQATAEADEMDEMFDGVLRHYKLAQFAPVNSPEFVHEIWLALASYDNLVMYVQTRLNSMLTPWERAVAGRWLGWRSLGPGLEDAYAGPFVRIPQPTRRSVSKCHD